MAHCINRYIGSRNHNLDVYVLRLYSAVVLMSKYLSICKALLEYSEDLDRVSVYNIAKCIHSSLDQAVGGLPVQLNVKKIRTKSSINLNLYLDSQSSNQRKIDLSRYLINKLNCDSYEIRNISVAVYEPGDSSKLGAKVSVCAPTIDFEKHARWLRLNS